MHSYSYSPLFYFFILIYYSYCFYIKKFLFVCYVDLIMKADCNELVSSSFIVLSKTILPHFGTLSRVAPNTSFENSVVGMWHGESSNSKHCRRKVNGFFKIWFLILSWPFMSRVEQQIQSLQQEVSDNATLKAERMWREDILMTTIIQILKSWECGVP